MWGSGGRVPPLSAKNIAKNRGKRGKKSGKNREMRKNREERAKIGKVLSLCPSWQRGLATLLPGTTHVLGLGHSKLKDAHPVNHFPGFWGKNIKNCPPSKLIVLIYLPAPEETTLEPFFLRVGLGLNEYTFAIWGYINLFAPVKTHVNKNLFFNCRYIKLRKLLQPHQNQKQQLWSARLKLFEWWF